MEPDLGPSLFVDSPATLKGDSDKKGMQPPELDDGAPKAAGDRASVKPDAPGDEQPVFEEGDIFGAAKKERQRDPRGAVHRVREGPDGELFLTKDAIFCCSLQNSVRKALIWCITWKWFDRFIMSIILVNAVFMGLADYSVVDDSGNPFPSDRDHSLQ